MEWYGYNNKLARDKSPVLIMPATVYLFGPLIDAHPLILTSLLYMETSLGEMGMTCANLSIDMQLYMVGQQVKWYIGNGLTPESGDPPGGLLWGTCRQPPTSRSREHNTQSIINHPSSHLHLFYVHLFISLFSYWSLFCYTRASQEDSHMAMRCPHYTFTIIIYIHFKL